MSRELPDLIIRDRDGKASLWVGRLNIWDLPHEMASGPVLAAIRSAFQRGRETAIAEIRTDISRIRDSYVIDHAWIDERKGEGRA